MKMMRHVRVESMTQYFSLRRDTKSIMDRRE
jgi:hypothetical protein